jgi:hypothetical protein
MMNLDTIGSALGAGLAAAGMVIVGARRWMSKPAEKKLDAMSAELGVGVGPSVTSLLMSTASAVQRLEEGAGHSRRGIDQILRVQGEHGDKLDSHERRLEVIETAHLLADKTEEIAAVLAEKTLKVAEALATKTEQTAKTLADQQENVK